MKFLIFISIFLFCNNLLPNTILNDNVIGFKIENQITDINYPPIPPSLIKDKYFFGSIFIKQDFNNDGLADYFFTGTMKPENIKVTGEDVMGLCGGKKCKGNLTSPSLFLGLDDGRYLLSDELLIDNRVEPGQSLGRQILVADFNNDKIKDIFIADTAIGKQAQKGFRDTYFLSQSNGTWLESSETHLSKKNYVIFDHGAAVGDIDNDGDVDIVLSELKNKISCWINDGSGKMKLKKCGSIKNAFGIELGDIDNDGDLDLVYAGHENRGSTDTGIALNNGKGNFDQKIKLKMIPKWSTVPEVSLWDLDNDNDLDIVLSRSGILYVGVGVQILENLGNKKFRSQFYKLLEAPADYVPVHEGNEWNQYISNFLFKDFDLDGHDDILLVAPRNNHLHIGASIFKNQGNMTFIHIPYGHEGNKINILKEGKFISHLASVSILDNLTDIGDSKVKDFLELNNSIYFDSLNIEMIGASNLVMGDDYFIYDGLFSYDDVRFPVTLCVQYYKDFNFIGNFLSLNYGYGFAENKELKKYGTRYCGANKGFISHWELDEGYLKNDTDIYPFLIEIENKWDQIFKNLPLFGKLEKDEIISKWK